MYTRPSLQKTQEFRPIAGHYQPKLAAWSSVLLDSRSGCEHSTFFFLLCCCPSPAVVGCWSLSRKNLKWRRKKQICSCCALTTSCMIATALCSLLCVPTTAIFLFASPRNFVARHRRFGICENDFKLSLQNLDVLPFLLCPPRPLFLTA